MKKSNYYIKLYDLIPLDIPKIEIIYISICLAGIIIFNWNYEFVRNYKLISARIINSTKIRISEFGFEILDLNQFQGHF